MHSVWSQIKFWGAVFAVPGALLWWWLHEPERSRPPGVLCPDAPAQTALTGKPRQHFRAGWLVTPLADYSIRARVLSRREYNYDPTSALSPLDLALGWGRMSDSAVIDRLDISQSGRFYRWHCSTLPLPMAEIGRSSANTHIIPASADVASVVKKAIRGDIVKLEGRLVECQLNGEGRPWRSSLTRDDTEGGACEIMWVEKAEIE